jgi:cell division inhibitor SulA
MKPALADLLHNPLLWRGDSLARADASIATGFPRLDRELPGGGWPRAALTELLLDGEGIGEIRLLIPVLKRLAQAGEWIALVAPPHIPYAPAFASAGVDPARVMVVRSADDQGAWWAAEQVLRANSAGALMFWPQSTRDQGLRRLQLAAQEGEALAFFFTDTRRAAQPSAAPLRVRLSLAGSDLCVDVFKRRGGVMTRPLLLDVSLASRVSSAQDPRPATPSVRLAAARERLPVSRTASFTRRYPVGGPQAHIWNRALDRGDEVRRTPSPNARDNVDQARDDGVVKRYRASVRTTL